MTRDANQIAQEYARQQQEPNPNRGRAVPEPKRGTLTVMSGFNDTATVLGKMNDVVVQFNQSGLIIAEHRDGAKEVFLPVAGWAIYFEPNDAGE